MGKDDIKEHQWKKGQSGNPKGRPPKIVKGLIKQLKEEGYERVSASEVREIYELLVALDEEKLVDVAKDKQQPMLARIVAKAILSKKGFDIIEKMLARIHAKEDDQVGKIEVEIVKRKK